MKNSLSRRSFIKQSVVGVAAAANASILTGLVSAQSASCVVVAQWFYFLYASDNDNPNERYDTREDAREAAGGIDMMSHKTPIGDKYLYDATCSVVPDPTGDVPLGVFPTKGGDDKWGFTIHGYQLWYWCE